MGSQERWSSPETVSYKNEAHLQEVLVADPSRVPGVAKSAEAVAELPTSGGPIDVCIIDLDGSLTVVECKLASNAEARRMVIGQVIDYASAIWSDGEAPFLRHWSNGVVPSSAKSSRTRRSLPSARTSPRRESIYV